VNSASFYDEGTGSIDIIYKFFILESVRNLEVGN
jgi:hypothetical protein